MGTLWESVLKDIQQSVRSLRRSAATSWLAIGTFGLGLGATTLIFSVFYSVLLQPLPFRDPGRLMQLWETRAGQGWEQASFSRTNFWDVQATKQNVRIHGGDAHLGYEHDWCRRSGASLRRMVRPNFFMSLERRRFLVMTSIDCRIGPGTTGVVCSRTSLDEPLRLFPRHSWDTHLHLNGRAYTLSVRCPKANRGWMRPTSLCRWSTARLLVAATSRLR